MSERTVRYVDCGRLVVGVVTSRDARGRQHEELEAVYRRPQPWEDHVDVEYPVPGVGTVRLIRLR